MTSVLVVRDGNRKRRTRCVEAAESELRLIDGLERSRTRAGPVAAVWYARPGTPSRSAEHAGAEGGGAAVIWGHAFERGARAPVEAAELLPENGSGAPPAARCFDGFHAWCAWREGAGLCLGADPLGLFPLYWTAPEPGVLLAASHPAALCVHEAVGRNLDPTGLAGLLLTNGLVGGRSVLEGVRRLPPGHVLRRAPDGPPEEVPVYRPRERQDRSSWTRQRLRSGVDEALERSIRRQLAPHDSVGVLLSGGLDSRLLAGYARETDARCSAITMGRRTDIEYRCAAEVAERLGWPHERREHAPEEIIEGARLEAQRSLLSNGMSAPHGWSLALSRGSSETGLLSGYVADAALAASHLHWAKTANGDGRLSAEAFVQSVNRWAVPLGVLRTTARPDFLEGHVEPLWSRLPHRLVPDGASRARRFWLADLRGRQRYHVGAALWRLSFAGWPVCPVDDRRVLDTLASVPVAALEDRALETELLKKRFPDLARLPLDRNARNTLPPSPRPADHLKRALRQWAGRLPGAWRLRQLRGERRYYYRLYDLESAAWRRIREQSESARDRLGTFFDPEALTRRYLPRPGETTEMRDRIIDAAGRKLLLGLMLLLR